MGRTHNLPHQQTPDKIHSHQRGTPTNAAEKITGLPKHPSFHNKMIWSSARHKKNTTPLTNTMYANLVSTHTMRKTYSDQRGKFIIQSWWGNNYIFVLYDYKSNYILFIPIKNRQAKSISDAWKLCYISIKKTVHARDLKIFDNECSNLLKSSFNKHNIDLQQVPPHTHRCNAAN